MIDENIRTYVITFLNEIRGGVIGLSRIYNKHEELNNIQPALMEKVIPMSLDEWVIALTDCMKDWENIDKYDKESLKTDREWLEGHGINGKEANEFIYSLLKANCSDDLSKLIRE